MAILCALNLAFFVLLAVAVVALYLQLRGKREALAVWKKATELQLGKHGAAIIDHAARLLLLEGGGQPPPAGSGARPSLSLARSAVQEGAGGAPTSKGRPVIGLSRPFQPSPAQLAAARGPHEAGSEEQSETPAQIRARLEAAEDARERARARGEASPLPTLNGDDEDTKIMIGTAARDAVAAATGALPPPKPPTPITARQAILLGVSPERAVSDPTRAAAEYRPRQESSPTLVSAGNTPPPSSKPRMMPLERIARLTEEDLARVDALAAAHHVSREAMLAIIAESGTKEFEARALTPTTPPGAPANDGRGPMLPPQIPRAPPALSVRVERRWHELLATAQAQGKLAEHCMGRLCLRDGYTVGACPCECEGCARVKDLLAQAKRETWRERGRE
jgi:hypothetical protein